MPSVAHQMPGITPPRPPAPEGATLSPPERVLLSVLVLLYDTCLYESTYSGY